MLQARKYIRKDESLFRTKRNLSPWVIHLKFITMKMFAWSCVLSVDPIFSFSTTLGIKHTRIILCPVSQGNNLIQTNQVAVNFTHANKRNFLTVYMHISFQMSRKITFAWTNHWFLFLYQLYRSIVNIARKEVREKYSFNQFKWHSASRVKIKITYSIFSLYQKYTYKLLWQITRLFLSSHM